ncbi:MAG: hypothetical protein RIR79_726 [Pseudomonadota bacterium]|jgi:hypothetical protein
MSDDLERSGDQSFAGYTEFADAIRLALQRAASEQWKKMVWCDATFHEWPLGERAVIASLNTWAGAGRQLIMIAHDYQYLVRHNPRFVQWRKTWSHLIECRARHGVDAEEFSSVLWSPHWAMHRIDTVRHRGSVGLEPQKRVLLKENLDEYYRQSSPAFPATTLGL